MMELFKDSVFDGPSRSTYFDSIKLINANINNIMLSGNMDCKTSINNIPIYTIMGAKTRKASITFETVGINSPPSRTACEFKFVLDFLPGTRYSISNKNIMFINRTSIDIKSGEIIEYKNNSGSSTILYNGIVNLNRYDDNGDTYFYYFKNVIFEYDTSSSLNTLEFIIPNHGFYEMDSIIKFQGNNMVEFSYYPHTGNGYSFYPTTPSIYKLYIKLNCIVED